MYIYWCVVVVGGGGGGGVCVCVRVCGWLVGWLLPLNSHGQFTKTR